MTNLGFFRISGFVVKMLHVPDLVVTSVGQPKGSKGTEVVFTVNAPTTVDAVIVGEPFIQNLQNSYEVKKSYNEASVRHRPSRDKNVTCLRGPRRGLCCQTPRCDQPAPVLVEPPRGRCAWWMSPAALWWQSA